MTMTRLLVPVRGDGKGEAVLTHAVQIARRFNSHIEVTHARARPQDMLPFGIALPKSLRAQIEAGATGLANEEESHLRGLFTAMMEREGVAVTDGKTMPPLDAPSASWHEEEGRQIDVIKKHGRLADLICVAKPDHELNIGTNTLNAALFATARPVLMCPPQVKNGSIGTKIAIAWNGSLEAARALALTLGLIDQATKIVVLDGGTADHGADGESLLRYLARRGVEAERREVDARSHPGRVIMKAAEESGADTLLMGAYGHSREMEKMLGGATQEVVDEAHIPVIFAH